MQIKILIADNHALLREGLIALLERIDDFSVVASARTGNEAVTLAGVHAPDIVLMAMGISDKNSIEATRRIVQRQQSTRVIGMSMYADSENVLCMLNAGASGYIIKKSGIDEMENAIRAVFQGKSYLSPDIASIVIQDLKKRGNHENGINVLTKREREILQFIAEGLSSRAIAIKLNLSFRTITSHRQNIMNKLDFHHVADLIKYAIRNGMISPE